jgi:hypothetical protein
MAVFPFLVLFIGNFGKDKDQDEINTESLVFQNNQGAIIMIQKSFSFICHSGLDPESSVSGLDSRLRGNDGLGTNVKKR